MGTGTSVSSLLLSLGLGTGFSKIGTYSTGLARFSEDDVNDPSSDYINYKHILIVIII